MKYALKSLLAAALVAGAAVGQAAVVAIDGASSVFAGAAPITFSEVAPGPFGDNPTIGSVSFGSFFAGQSLGDIFTCGAATCVTGAPTAGTALSLTSPAGVKVSILGDAAAGLNSPVLSGSGSLTQGAPIAMLFAQDVSAVSFLAGSFNNLGNTLVILFSRTGQELFRFSNPAQVTDPTAPIDFFNFAFGSSDGANSIAGVLISQTGTELAGFGVDNVRSVITGTPTTGEPPSETSEPTSLALVGLALLAVGASRRKRKG